ncbi:hypothetical protein ACVWW4_004940 [Bradyrhizobium sp. LB7.1]
MMVREFKPAGVRRKPLGIDSRLRPHSAHTRSITGVCTEALPVTESVGLPP